MLILRLLYNYKLKKKRYFRWMFYKYYIENIYKFGQIHYYKRYKFQRRFMEQCSLLYTKYKKISCPISLVFQWTKSVRSWKSSFEVIKKSSNVCFTAWRGDQCSSLPCRSKHCQTFLFLGRGRRSIWNIFGFKIYIFHTWAMSCQLTLIG